MEFPVYVASDCRGRKLNVALRFDPQVDSLETLFRAAQDAFALFTLQELHRGPLPPFAAAYLFSDAECQWKLLEQRTQLTPLCQIYIFRDNDTESVGLIPEPINLVLGLAAHASPPAAQSTVHRGTNNRHAALQGRFSTVHDSTPRPSSERRMVSQNEGYLPVSGAASPRFAPPDSAYRTPADEGDARVSHLPPQAREAETDALPPADTAASSFGPVHSHRFRLQLMSPPLDPDLRRHVRQLQTADLSLHRHESRAFDPSSFVMPASPAAHPRTSTPSRHVPIPHSWYSSIAAAAAAADEHRGYPRSVVSDHSSFAPSPLARYEPLTRHYGTPSYRTSQPRSPNLAPAVSSGWRSLSRRDSSRSSSSSRIEVLSPPTRYLGAPPLHPSSVRTTQRRSQRSGSILREERERVEQRMHMSLHELRQSLQEEERGYERRRSQR